MRLSLSAALLASVCLFQDALAAPLDSTTTISECYVFDGTSLAPSTNCGSNDKNQVFDVEKVDKLFYGDDAIAIVGDGSFNTLTGPEPDCAEIFGNSTTSVKRGCGGGEICNRTGVLRVSEQGAWTAPFGAAILSSDQTCSENTCPIAATQTHSISQSWSAGLSGLFQSIISASVDYTWTETVLTSSSYTFTLSACQIGHIAFDPYYNYVKGTCYMTGCGQPDSSPVTCEGWSPQKNSDGFARGNVYLVIQNYPCSG